MNKGVEFDTFIVWFLLIVLDFVKIVGGFSNTLINLS